MVSWDEKARSDSLLYHCFYGKILVSCCWCCWTQTEGWCSLSLYHKKKSHSHHCCLSFGLCNKQCSWSSKNFLISFRLWMVWIGLVWISSVLFQCSPYVTFSSLELFLPCGEQKLCIFGDTNFGLLPGLYSFTRTFLVCTQTFGHMAKARNLLVLSAFEGGITFQKLSNSYT